MILVLANACLAMFNTIYPPCNTVEDYFKSARTLSKDRVTSLDSIQNDLNSSYFSSKNTKKNTNFLSYMENNKDYHDSMESNLDENEDAKKSNFYNAVDKIFTSKNYDQESTNKSVSKYNGEHISVFETEMEGINAGINRKRKNKNNSKAVMKTQRDGYSNF